MPNADHCPFYSPKTLGHISARRQPSPATRSRRSLEGTPPRKRRRLSGLIGDLPLDVCFRAALPEAGQAISPSRNSRSRVAHNRRARIDCSSSIQPSVVVSRVASDRLNSTAGLLPTRCARAPACCARSAAFSQLLRQVRRRYVADGSRKDFGFAVPDGSHPAEAVLRASQSRSVPRARCTASTSRRRRRAP